MSSSKTSSSSSRKPRVGSKSNIMFTNAVYYPNYAVYDGYTPSQLNYSCISLVYYAFAKVVSTGEVFLSDEYADAGAPCDGVKGALGSLMYLKQQHPHLQVLLSVGGAESTSLYPMVASNPVMRDNFARSVYGLVEASGLDGVDISWICPTDAQQAADFLDLLAQVRVHLSDDRYLVTAALPANNDILRLIDLRQMDVFVDLVNLAAYDMYGPWSAKCGHQSQLYGHSKDDPSAASSVQYLMSHGMPSKKILLGIPLYGRSFLNSTGPGHSFSGPGGNEDGTFPYSELPRRHTREHVDKRAVAAYCSGGDGGFVSYDNPDTVKTKASFCKQKSLGGLCYWAAPSDAKDSKRSLIATGFRVLHGT